PPAEEVPRLPGCDAAAPSEREREEGRARLLRLSALPGRILVQRQGHPGASARTAGDGTALPGVRHADREAWPGPHPAVLLVLCAVAPWRLGLSRQTDLDHRGARV